MSEDGDHHYVPQFHLNRWAGNDGRIVQWGRAPFSKKLFRKRVTSAETAYRPGLYALSAASKEKQQLIETEIFGRIDSSASLVLDKLICRARITLEERMTWAFYLNAQIVRVPHLVGRMQVEMARRLEEELTQDLAAYNEARGNDPEPTLYDWAKKNAPDQVANSHLNVLINMLRNEKALNRIMELRWTVRDISSTGNRLMLGDDPVHREVSLYNPAACWLVPLSPTHIFFAASIGHTIHQFERMSARDVVQQSNMRSLRNARKFAYGDGNSDFIDKNLLTKLVATRPDGVSCD